jgi:6-phosphogluconolactonase
MQSSRWLKSAWLVLAITLFPPALRADNFLVYFGTYTETTSAGIYVSHFDPTTGKLTAPELAAKTDDPSFLAVSPDHRFLYAVNEAPKATGSVTAYRLDATTGKLDLLNQQSSGGVSPCHLIVDRGDKFVIAANYNSGNVEVLPIQADGSLGAPTCLIQHHGSSVNPARQEGPHAHCIAMDASGRVYVCDLGLDKVMIYHFNERSGQLTTNEIASTEIEPGSGPRHIVFHPNGKYAYVINEMAGTVTAFTRDPSNGNLTEIQTISTLPEDFHGNNTSAEIAIHPSGKFLYASNRGHNSIAVFRIDKKTGRLTSTQTEPLPGKTPRSFAIDPTGKFLIVAEQDSNNVVIFRVNPKNGELTAMGGTLQIGEPVCVTIVPAE